MFDYAIIGGGIVGLATAMTLGRRDPDARIVVFEKEPDFARTRVDATVASYTPAFTINRAASRPICPRGQSIDGRVLPGAWHQA